MDPYFSEWKRNPKKTSSTTYFSPCACPWCKGLALVLFALGLAVEKGSVLEGASITS
jgi:hypothetical protein